MTDLPSDRIALHGIEVWAHHGVLAHEREIGQRFLVDVTIHVDLGPAAASDALVDTVDYGALAAVVAEAATTPTVDLIEVVADRVATAVLDEDELIERVDVVLHKPAAPLPVPARDVTIEISRTRLLTSDG